MMRHTYVAIDDGPGFPAFVGRRRWNGWARPWFTRDVVDQIIREYGNNGHTVIAWDGDEIVIAYTDGSETERVKGTRFSDATRWAIGSGAWAWDDIDDD